MSADTQRMLINVEEDETRIALVRSGRLENLFIEQDQRAQNVGNIYRGVVTKVQPSFQAAFVDYGQGKNGFLAISDVNQQVYKPNKDDLRRPAINHLLKSGQKVLVQVLKDEIDHKGATLTTNLSLPGRFLVFMPNSDRGGVSKRIEDEEQRNRLKHLLKGLVSEEASAIIRTAGVDRSLSELKRDFMLLRRNWTRIRDVFEKSDKPGLLYREEDAVVRMLRDYFDESITEVVIDDAEAFQRALEFFQANMPAQQKRLQLYLGERSLFSEHDIEKQIGALNSSRASLPSGGSLVISPTEALVSVDVNSGRSTQERNIEETALRTNLEAANEVARQLRLRNLGGLIVIDFIDMEQGKNCEAVVERMAEALVRDKARWSLGEISKFGLLEMSRQRIASSLSNNDPILSTANRIVRRILDLAVDYRLHSVKLRLPLELATHLLNQSRRKLNQIEADYELSVQVLPDFSLSLESFPEMEIVLLDDEQEEERRTLPVLETDEEPTTGRRRRRSRRRRDSQDGDSEQNTRTTEETPEVEAERNGSPVPEEEPPEVVAKETEASAEIASVLETPAPSSRSRRGRRSKPAAAETEVEASEADKANAEVEEAPASKPKPVLSRAEGAKVSKPKKKAPIPGLLFNSVHENVEDDDKPWASPALPEWRRRNQRASVDSYIFSSKHLDPETGEVVEATTTPESVPAEPPVAEESAPKKPPRSRRKPAVRTKPETETVSTEAATSEAETATPAEAPKPKPVLSKAEGKAPARRPRSKAKTEAPEAVAAEEVQAAPKRSGRGRKPAKPEVAVDAETTETPKAKAPAKPRKPAAKKPVKAEAPAPESAAAESEAAPKAPTRGREAAAKPKAAAGSKPAVARSSKPKAAAKPASARSRKPEAAAKPDAAAPDTA